MTETFLGQQILITTLLSSLYCRLLNIIIEGPSLRYIKLTILRLNPVTK